MNREIKFRAFVDNKIHGKGVFSVRQIHFYPFVYTLDMEEGSVNFFDFDNLKLMQYTGLHDKNGREIYEGDVLNSEHGQIGNVFWDEPELSWKVYWVKGNMHYYHSYLCNCSKSEVIGNIYENPELLGVIENAK